MSSRDQDSSGLRNRADEVLGSGCQAASIGAAIVGLLGGVAAYFIVGPYEAPRAGHVAGGQIAALLEFGLWVGKLLLGAVLGAAAGATIGGITGSLVAARRKPSKPAEGGGSGD